MEVKKGDVVVCALSGDYDKPRPAVVVQSDLFNETHSSITICPITMHLIEAPLFRLTLSPKKQNGLKETSQIMVDKMTTLKREKVRKKLGTLSPLQIESLNDAIRLWLELSN